MHKKKEIALGFISYLAQPPCSTINRTQATISSNAMDNHKNLEQSQASRYDKLCDLIKKLSKNKSESMEVRDRRTQPLVQSLALIPRDTPLVRISTLWQRQAHFYGGLMADVKVGMVTTQKPADMEVEEVRDGGELLKQPMDGILDVCRDLRKRISLMKVSDSNLSNRW
ncbi:unnamed protein product [Cochlearia groenlandica]